MDDSLGSVLRGLRHATGKTLEEVAEATGISVAMLSRAERNQRIPSLDTIAALARHYGVPAEELQGHAIAQRSQARSGNDLTNLWAARNLMARSGNASVEPRMAAPSERFGVMRASEPGRLSSLEYRFGAEGVEGVALMAEALPADEPPPDAALASLEDLAYVAEVAVDAARRAAARARESGDPERIAAAERVLTRLRRALEG